MWKWVYQFTKYLGILVIVHLTDTQIKCAVLRKLFIEGIDYVVRVSKNMYVVDIDNFGKH